MNRWIEAKDGLVESKGTQREILVIVRESSFDGVGFLLAEVSAVGEREVIGRFTYVSRVSVILVANERSIVVDRLQWFPFVFRPHAGETRATRSCLLVLSIEQRQRRTRTDRAAIVGDGFEKIRSLLLQIVRRNQTGEG